MATVQINELHSDLQEGANREKHSAGKCLLTVLSYLESCDSLGIRTGVRWQGECFLHICLPLVQVHLEFRLFPISWVCLLCFVAALFFEMECHKLVLNAWNADLSHQA